MLEVLQRRASLPRARAALSSGTLRVGFIGGSITAATATHRSYSEQVLSGLCEAFPKTRVLCTNAGIGATNSTLGAFRIGPDVLAHGCDLLFVEFAVNDWALDADTQLAACEGLLRQALLDGARDVVLLYTYRREMYEAMAREELPASIAVFEALAAHYHLSSVWMGLHALRQVQRGLLRWETWLPDGLHPDSAGSRYYAEAVLSFVIAEMRATDSAASVYPAPLGPSPWERVELLPLETLTWRHPWAVRRFAVRAGVEKLLSSSVPGASLQIPFTGTGFFLGQVTGSKGADFRYRVDQGDWQTHTYERLPWMGTEGWYHGVLLARGLYARPHTLMLETLLHNAPEEAGPHMNIALAGVLK